jgi:hypothetical protein
MKNKSTGKFLKSLLIIGLCGFVISGCKKTSPAATDSDTTASNENAFSQSTFNDAGNISDQAASSNMSTYRLNADANGSLLSNCATIIWDTLNHTNADTLIVDFGTTNCLCHDGRYRRGKINIMYTKRHYFDSLNVITLTFNNYFVNDYGVSGTKIITNQGRINGQQTYNVVVNNGTITKPNNGGSFTWNSNITRKWIAGQNTPFFWYDDVYSFTGNSNGVSSTGTGYVATIVTPLERALSCYWIGKGILDFTPSGKATRIIDYGNGTCDNVATVTINGHQYTVYMW